MHILDHMHIVISHVKGLRLSTDPTYKEMILGEVDRLAQFRPSHLYSTGEHGSPCQLILCNL